MASVRQTSRKIAYYCAATGVGAAGDLLDVIVRTRELSAGWYQPLLIVPLRDEPLIERVEALEIPYAVLPMPKAFLATNRVHPVRSLFSGALSWSALRSYGAGLQEIIAAEEPALLHTTGTRCHSLAARLDSNVPVLWHLQEVLTPGPTRALLHRLRKDRRVHVLANSYTTAVAFDADAERPSVVYPGIDVKRFVAGRRPMFRELFGFAEDRPVVGIIGGVQRVASIAEFIEMAARLADRARFVVVDADLHDAGRPRAHRTRLEDRVAELGLGGVLEFIDDPPDTVEVLQGLDLLVSGLPEVESVGRDAIEAMACGVPVVAPATGGALEIIEDRICGRLFPPGDVDSMARAVAEVIGDEELRSRCVVNGRQRVLDRFTLDHQVGGLLRAYDRILGPYPLALS